MSFLFDNGLAISGIEVGGVCLPTPKPFIPDTLCSSRHGQANWLSGPPKNDVGETHCQRQRPRLCLLRKKSSPGCSGPEGVDSLTHHMHCSQVRRDSKQRLQFPPRKTMSAYFLLM